MKYRLLEPLGGQNAGDILESDDMGDLVYTLRGGQMRLITSALVHCLLRLNILEEVQDGCSLGFKDCNCHTAHAHIGNETNDEEWPHVMGDPFYYVTPECDVKGDYWCNSDLHKSLKRAGNCLRTVKAASRAAEKVKKLLLSLPRE